MGLLRLASLAAMASAVPASASSASASSAAAAATTSVVAKVSFASPFATAANACGPRQAGAQLAPSALPLFFFLPLAPLANGSAFITVVDLADVLAPSWSAIALEPSIASHLEGATIAAVAGASGGAADGFLFVGGGTGAKGASGAAWSYSMESARWTALPIMSPASYNLCSTVCGGGVLTATGAAKRLVRGGAPANRQIYRFNVSAGTKLENNMKKQRAGAGCVCAEHWTFWAGGEDDSGLTSSVEIWEADPACPMCRNGLPVWDLDSARSGVGAAACGGKVVFAGGMTKKGATGSVEVFTSNGTSPSGEKVSFALSAPTGTPALACIGSVVLVGGGTNGKACSMSLATLDLGALPAPGATLPAAGVTLSAAVSVGAASNGMLSVFFNGEAIDVFSLTSAPLPGGAPLLGAAPPLSAPLPFDGKVRAQADGSSIAYLPPPAAANHAASIEQLPDGSLLLAWFSGTKEEASDCAIAVSRLPAGSTQWSAPQVVSERDGFSNQNPVLFYDAQTKSVLLFHSQLKAASGEGLDVLWQLSSRDGGATWSKPAVFLDLTKSKQGVFDRNRIILSAGGGLIFPCYFTTDKIPNSPFLLIADAANHSKWGKPQSIKDADDLVQPSLVRTAPGTLTAFFRDRNAKNIFGATSMDEGGTWTKPTPAQAGNLPNNNAGIEAWQLASGNTVLLFNNKTGGGTRSPMTAALSRDGGRSWFASRNLQVHDDNSTSATEFSYPTVLQTPDGMIHAAYTYDRACIKYIAFSEAWISAAAH